MRNPYIMAIDKIHTPVMLERCFDLLAPALQAPGAVLVDCTLGMGGHAAVFLERLPGLTLVGLDRDLDALAIAEERLKGFGDRVKLVHTVYDGIAGALADLKIAAAQGILTPPAQKYSNARMSGMVATIALLVMFALVGLLIWLA